MSDSYTTLWSAHRWQLVTRYNQVGARLEVLFGGPHISHPRFRRYGVKPGDYVYPIMAHKGALFVLGRMRVKEILSLEDYVEQYPDVLATTPRYMTPFITFDKYLDRYPEKRYLAPTCTDEVVVGEEGTPIRHDVRVPPGLLDRLRYRSQRRERAIKHVVDGRLKSVISLHGIYRLSEESAREIEALLMSKIASSDGEESARRPVGVEPAAARQARKDIAQLPLL